MAIAFSALMLGEGWCQSSPSGPGETLKHSQDTMEYYELQHKLQKGQDRLGEKKDDAKENGGEQNEPD
jgi:hypothetical protein